MVNWRKVFKSKGRVPQLGPSEEGNSTVATTPDRESLPSQSESPDRFEFINIERIFLVLAMCPQNKPPHNLTTSENFLAFTALSISDGENYLSRVTTYHCTNGTVRQISYKLDGPHVQSSAHKLSPDGNILLRWQTASDPNNPHHKGEGLECTLQALSTSTTDIIAELEGTFEFYRADMDAVKWVNNSTVYLPESRRSIVTKWSIGSDRSEKTIITPLTAISMYQILRFHVTNDEKWMVYAGISLIGPTGGNGLLQIHNTETEESRVTSGVACCITEADVYGGKKALLVIADVDADKLLFKVEQLDSNAPGHPFEPVSVSVPRSNQGDIPAWVAVFDHLPIAAVITFYSDIYFFELHTGAYLYSKSMAPDRIWYGSNAPRWLHLFQANTSSACRLSINTRDLVGYIRHVLKNDILASGIAIRAGLPGAEDVVLDGMYGNYRDITEGSAAVRNGN